MAAAAKGLLHLAAKLANGSREHFPDQIGTLRSGKALERGDIP
jgi:hypothetical protein